MVMAQNLPVFSITEPAKACLPGRDSLGNKATFGKVLVVGGGFGMAGAVLLCAKAAYRAGAGMVKILSVPENRIILQTGLPEAMFGTWPEAESAFAWADVVILGPGLGRGEAAKEVFAACLKTCQLPMVIDADGLYFLAREKELKATFCKTPHTAVLTPHVGELAGLLACSPSAIKADPIGCAYRAACQFEATLLSKDAVSYICQAGEAVCKNTSGNSGMATAGSGDVLAGIVGAFLAQGLNPYEAACKGAYVHGAAGSVMAAKIGEHALLAGDIIEGLCRL